MRKAPELFVVFLIISLLWIFSGSPVVFRSKDLSFQFPPKIEKAEAAISFKVGQFTKPTAASSSNVISGVGFQPKAVIFMWTSQTAAGSLASSTMGMGFVSGPSPTSSGAIAYCSESTNAGSSSDTTVRISTSSIVMLAGDNQATTGCGTLVGRADLVSMNSDGFTLNWTTANNQAYLIRYIAIGGTDVASSAVGTMTLTNGTGNQSVSSLSFQPDFVMLMSANTTSTYDVNVTQAGSSFSLGFATAATSTEQAGVGLNSEHNQGTADTVSIASTTSVLNQYLAVGNPAAIDGTAIFNSMDANGFTLNKVNATTNSVEVFYLAIEGPQFKVGSINQPTAASSSNQTAGVGFQPVGLFMTTNAASSASPFAQANGSVIVMGASGSATTSVGQVGIADLDGATTPDPDQFTTSTRIVSMLVPATNALPTIAASAFVQSFNSDGFTLNWPVANAATRRVLYWAIGNAPANSAPTMGNLTLNGGSAITLIENTSTSIAVTGTATDINGNADISFATGTIYRSGVGATCTSDENNCYRIASSSCAKSNCSGNSCDFTCTAKIQYFADPTDSGAFSAQNWLGEITATDAAGTTGVSTTASGVELNTLFSLNVTSAINFGSLSPGGDTGAVNQISTTTNTGNAAIDAELSGNNMVFGANTITVGNEKYATSSFTYSSCTVCTALTTTATTYELDLAKPISTAAVEDTIFWGLSVPNGNPPGTYTGTSTFTGVAD